MSLTELTNLNIVCSSIGHATIDEIWAAHSVYGQSGMSRADLDSSLEKFIEEGIIEIDDSRVEFRGDQFEEIFIRLWTLQKVQRRHNHLEFLGHLDFKHILTRNLEYLLCDIRPSGLRIMSTCCFGMAPVHLRRGLANLADLPKEGKAYYTVAYLHEAIIRSGMPTALDLIEVTCSFNGTEAVRWLYASGDDTAVDLEKVEPFQRAVERMRDIGGELRASHERIVLRSWPEILGWLASQGTSGDVNESKGYLDDARRSDMAHQHIDAAIRAYSGDDVSLAVSHLESAFALENSWNAANNLAYIMLKNKEYDKSLEWVNRALDLHESPHEFALSSYNFAMAEAELGNYSEARSRLSDASVKLQELEYQDNICYYLMLPDLEDGKVLLHEEAEVDLTVAVARALEIVDLIVRLKKLTKLLD
jgi:tetratricopeptide (TPR) repeat protein